MFQDLKGCNPNNKSYFIQFQRCLIDIFVVFLVLFLLFLQLFNWIIIGNIIYCIIMKCMTHINNIKQ